MKYLLLFIMNILTLNASAQSREAGSPIETIIKIELVKESDTLYSDRPYQLYLKIKNISKKAIYIPKEVDLISNLYPNGEDIIWDGGIADLNIDPMSAWAAIHVENTIESEPQKFIKIKPNASVKLPLVDLSSHIQRFNESIDSEDLKIKSDTVYKLQVSYKNSWKKKGREEQSFVGNATSQEVTVYIK